MNRICSLTISLLASGLTLSLPAYAQLQPLDDQQLEETVGQAFIEMESRLDGNTQFSRVTFGQNVKIQANIDSLTLGGSYDNALGLGNGTDFNASNLSLGYIDTTTGEIVPFQFTNPYIEWATNDTTNDMLGFRLGFEDAKGILQGDFSSFSGNIGVTINGNPSSLFTGAGGTITDNRATYIGETAGSCLDGSDCISLGNIQSISVADSDGTSTSDFFLSFQTSALDWGQGPVTNKGFFMNIPSDTNVDITDGNSGTGRLATEFIDRGVGRWNVVAP